MQALMCKRLTKLACMLWPLFTCLSITLARLQHNDTVTCKLTQVMGSEAC